MPRPNRFTSSSLITIKVEGIPTVQRAISKFRESIQTSIQRKTYKTMAGKMRIHLKRQARLVSRQSKYRVGQGAMEQAMKFKVARRKANKSSWYVIVGPQRRVRFSVEYYNSFTDKIVKQDRMPTKYLHLLEYGFVAKPFGIRRFGGPIKIKVLPHPILRPVMNQHLSEYITIFNRRFVEVTKQELRKLNFAIAQGLA